MCAYTHSKFIFHSCLYTGKLSVDVIYMLLDELQKKGSKRSTVL